MIQMRTNLDVADNSGAKTVQCMHDCASPNVDREHHNFICSVLERPTCRCHRILNCLFCIEERGSEGHVHMNRTGSGVEDLRGGGKAHRLRQLCDAVAQHQWTC